MKVKYLLQLKTHYGSYFSKVSEFESEKHFSNYCRATSEKFKIIGIFPMISDELMSDIIKSFGGSITIKQAIAQAQARLDWTFDEQDIEHLCSLKSNNFTILNKIIHEKLDQSSQQSDD